MSQSVAAAPLQDQPTFSSHQGQLNLLVAAIAHPVSLGNVNPEAWTYQVCERHGNESACPPGSATVAPYGGVRLQLEPKDRLRIHFMNQLPLLTCDDAKHAAPSDRGSVLLRNPTNIHTHGLIVEPRRATAWLPSYGDYIYVEDQKPANVVPPGTKCPDTPPVSPITQPHPVGHGDITDNAEGPIDYDIDVPESHPSGLFWFHPHVHGLALNQVSAGLSGSITVGGLKNYICDEPGCAGLSGGIGVNYLMLKDTQVTSAGMIQVQQDPGFCNPTRAGSEPARQGFCAGTANDGSKWFHTINGQVYPEIDVKPAGQIWRITNAAASRSYHLQLVDEAGAPLIMQVLSIDGIAFNVPRGTSMEDLRSLFGRKIDLESCPDEGPAVSPQRQARPANEPVCAIGLRMMPSASAEVWVARRNPAQGNHLVLGNQATRAVLRTTVYQTGETPQAGDNWPEIDLATVSFDPAPSGFSFPMSALGVKGEAMQALSRQGALSAPPQLRMTANGAPVDVATARSLLAQQAPAAMPQGLSLAPHGITPGIKLGLETPIDCHNLPAGHRRRIFFGKIQPNTDTFGLGYEEVDGHGNPVPGTQQPVAAFNPDDITVCLQVPILANVPQVEEVWELVNLTSEDHNFHIHQTRFQVISGGTGLPAVPGSIQGMAVLQDNVPVPHSRTRQGAQSGCDGTIATWRAPAGGGQSNCVSPPVVVKIPFREIGDFVYHCHILEHEDGGMMARIRVVPAPLHEAKNTGQASQTH